MAGKAIAVPGPRKLVDASVCRDKFNFSYSGCQILILNAGSMSRRGTGTTNGNAEKGCQILEGPTLIVELDAEVVILNAGAYARGFRGRVHLDGLQSQHGNLRVGRVGDAVEGVPRAEGSQMGYAAHCVLYVGHR